MGKKRVVALLAMVFMALIFSACGSSKKEEAKIREVAQKYFDALKIGDQEGIYDCYLPTERQKRDAENELLGFVSKLVLKVDVTEVISNWDFLFGEESEFAKYKYKAADVDMSEDGTEAVVYVDVFEEKELRGSMRIDMTKYDGEWYVVMGTLADDERTSDEKAGMEDSGITGPSNRIWIIMAIVLGVVAVVVLLAVFLQLGRGRKRTTVNPPVSPQGGSMAPEDIMCSCGTINPVGVRICMGCGKKLKRRK